MISSIRTIDAANKRAPSPRKILCTSYNVIACGWSSEQPSGDDEGQYFSRRYDDIPVE